MHERLSVATPVPSRLQRLVQRDPLELARYAVRIARCAVGIPNRVRTADRLFLEDVVIPHYARRADVQRVLFVGTDWFTKHYERAFRDRSYWTMEPIPWRRVFGARRHLVGVLQRLGEHVAPGFFDLIICNGVYGWGLESRADCEDAFAACFWGLRPGGELVLGWNDVEAHRPVPLEQIASLRRFSPVPFPPAGTWRWLANPENRHTFDFYRRPA